MKPLGAATAARLVAATVLAAGTASAVSAPPLAACIAQENPPFSYDPDRSERRGIDADAAQLIARELGRDLHLVWVLVPERGGFGRALKETIQAGRCDLFLGVPESDEMKADLAERHLAGSRPYFAVGYLFVTAPGTTAATLAQARRAARIGVATATPADLYLFREHFNRFPYGNNRALVEALRHGEVDMALAWTPALANSGGGEVVAAEQPSDPSLRTNLSIAVRGAELQKAVDDAIDRLAGSGAFGELARSYGVPPIATGATRQ